MSGEELEKPHLNGRFSPPHHQVSNPGLPLGIYTTHWQRSSLCASGIVKNGKCLPAYAPDDNYDFQGIFDVA